MRGILGWKSTKGPLCNDCMLHQFKASIECEAYIQEPCLQRLWPQSSSSCRKEGSRVAEQQIPQSTLDPLPKLHAF